MEQKIDTMEFLIDAKAALEELNTRKRRRSDLAVEEKRQERLLEGEKKAVEDEILRTIRERKEAIEDSYDKELAQDKEKLRRLRGKKERAKNIGRQERIREETAELLAHNREITTRVSTSFRKNGLPSWCNSWFFFALFMPATLWERLFDLLCFLVVFEGIPCGIYGLLSQASPWTLAGLYSGVILIFGGGYVSLLNRFKVPKRKTLQQGRAMRDEIASNKKKVKAITHAIHRDSSEDSYDLDSYNYEIARLEAELEDVAARKQDNMNTFEAVTKRVIADEIQESNRERIAGIEEEYKKLHQALLEADQDLRETTMQVTERYESYLGKEFLDASKVEQLIQLIEWGEASNITEAISAYRDSKI